MNNDNVEVPEYMFKMDFDKYEKRKLITTVFFLLLIAAVIITLCIGISEFVLNKQINEELTQMLTNDYNILFIR